MAGYINTIRDLEAETYGIGGAFGGNDILKQAGVTQGLHTAHDIADTNWWSSGKRWTINCG